MKEVSLKDLKITGEHKNLLSEQKEILNYFTAIKSEDANKELEMLSVPSPKKLNKNERKF